MKSKAASPTPKPPAEPARLVMGGREIALASGASVLGRLPEATLWIDSVGVSRRHARVTVTAAGVSIEDLGSTNGTFVNGERVDGARPLSDGDQIHLGPVLLVFRASAGP